MLLLLSADFFLNQIFQKILSGALSKSLDLDWDRHFVSPDQVQSVCKGYQQRTNVAASKYRVKTIGNKKNQPVS